MSKNQVVLKVDGMTCVNCAKSVENAISEKGGDQISVNLADKEVVFENISETHLNEYISHIENRGYKVLGPSEDGSIQKKN